MKTSTLEFLLKTYDGISNFDCILKKLIQRDNESIALKYVQMCIKM